MKQYRVKVGLHMQEGKTYTKGQIVKSEANLSELFREKFEEVSAPAPVQPPPPSTPAKKKAPGTVAKKGDDWEE